MMKHISKFNESKGITIYEGDQKIVYTVVSVDTSLTYGDESVVYVFLNKMKAADKFIELVNEEFDEEFERYYEDGERLFAEVDENPDYEKAVRLVRKSKVIIKMIYANIE